MKSLKKYIYLIIIFSYFIFIIFKIKQRATLERLASLKQIFEDRAEYLKRGCSVIHDLRNIQREGSFEELIQYHLVIQNLSLSTSKVKKLVENKYNYNIPNLPFLDKFTEWQIKRDKPKADARVIKVINQVCLLAIRPQLTLYVCLAI